MQPEIVAVHQSPGHSFSRESVAALTLIAGLAGQAVSIHFPAGPHRPLQVE